MVFLRRSRVDPARPPGSGRAWSGIAPGSVRLPSAGAVSGPGRPSPRRLLDQATNSNKGVELAGSEHLANGRLDVAEDQSAAVLPRFAVQGDKIAQRRRSRETDSAEIDHQLRPAILAADAPRIEIASPEPGPGRVSSNPRTPRSGSLHAHGSEPRASTWITCPEGRRDRGARVRAGGVDQDASKRLMSDHLNRASCTRTSTVCPPGRSATRITRRAASLRLTGQRIPWSIPPSMADDPTGCMIQKRRVHEASGFCNRPAGVPKSRPPSQGPAWCPLFHHLPAGSLW